MSQYQKPRTMSGILLLFAFQAAVMGCGGGEQAAKPEVTFDGTTDASSLKVGEMLSLKVNIHAEGELQSIDVMRKVDADEKVLQQVSSSFQSTNAHSFNFTYEVENFPQKSIILTFKVTDKKGGTTSKEYTLTAQRNPAIRTWTGIRLGGPSNTTIGNFFSSTTGEVFTKAQANENISKIDVVYMTSGSLSYFVAPSKVGEEPGFAPIPGAALTEYKYASDTFTAAQFDAMTDDTAIAALDIQESNDSFIQGSIMLFKTADGRKGIMKITSRTSGSTGSITMDVKVQKYPSR